MTDDTRIHAHQTPADFNMEDEDIVDMREEQEGGGC